MSECALCKGKFRANAKASDSPRPFILEHGVRKEICSNCNDLIGQAVDLRLETAVKDAVRAAMAEYKPDTNALGEALDIDQIKDAIRANAENAAVQAADKVNADLGTRIGEIVKTQVADLVASQIKTAVQQELANIPIRSRTSRPKHLPDCSPAQISI